MTDVEPSPTSLEDISAGLLNGAMVTLLGCAFAGVLGWQVVSELTGRLPDLLAIAVDEPSAPARDSLFGLVWLVITFAIIRRGVRHIRQNLTLLREHRSGNRA
jgi:hypothetical protein